jgi:hypothetical protein
LAPHSTEERDLQSNAVVADIRELCVEFQRAIAALATDNVAALESSTEVQEGLVKKLQDGLRKQPTGERSSTKAAAADFHALFNLNRVYASLLQSALRTARLRASLCQTYKQNFPAAPEPAAATGWSCEV